MIKTLQEVTVLINEGHWLHIAGNEDLLRQLPKGNWIGGTTEYFVSESGGIISHDLLFVDTFTPYECKIIDYDDSTISNITKDAYSNGFSILIIPYNSSILGTYSKNAPDYDEMYIKNIVGWVSGSNQLKPEQVPLSVNGFTKQYFSDKATVMHICLPNDKVADVGIVNIFEPQNDKNEIEFYDDGFSTSYCKIDGEEVILADFIRDNKINTKLPIIGDYAGADINISIKEVSDKTVLFYAPVFKNIKYRFSKEVSDYEKEFNIKLSEHDDSGLAFTCNCYLNFLYGDLKDKKIMKFFGPITLGEIAYQLLNQTLVYVKIK